jgi:hypothetical protein
MNVLCIRNGTLLGAVVFLQVHHVRRTKMEREVNKVKVNKEQTGTVQISSAI